jgi:Zn-dependent peptidase ImmA (M78 family)
MLVQDSDLGHHSKPLNSEEFRGFAIADSVASLIFINTADSLNAQLFTLIHELVHILKGESGISDNDMSTVHPTEVFCNAVAGGFLVAESEFIRQWQSISKNEPMGIVFEKLAKEFYVSRHVIARRTMTLNYISQSEYQDYIARLHEEYLASKGKRFKWGPSYYVVKNSKLSTQFSQAVVSETIAGKMLYRDGWHLLGMKPSNIKSFAKETGMRI